MTRQELESKYDELVSAVSELVQERERKFRCKNHETI